MPHAGLNSTFAVLKFHYKYSRKYVLTYRNALQNNLLFLEETMPNSALERLLEKQSLILISAELCPESQKMNLYVQVSRQLSIHQALCSSLKEFAL